MIDNLGIERSFDDAFYRMVYKIAYYMKICKYTDEDIKKECDYYSNFIVKNRQASDRELQKITDSYEKQNDIQRLRLSQLRESLDIVRRIKSV